MRYRNEYCSISLSQAECRRIREHAEQQGVTYQEIVKQMISKL